MFGLLSKRCERLGKTTEPCLNPDGSWLFMAVRGFLEVYERNNTLSSLLNFEF